MKLKDENKTINFIDSFLSSKVSFWIDSSGGPENLCNKSFYGQDPKYYFYGSINEIILEDCENGVIEYISSNALSFLEEKLTEEKNNENGIFVGYCAYDLFDDTQSYEYPNFFFAYFDKTVGDSFPFVDNPSFSCANSSISSNMTDDEYLSKVFEIKEEIKKGNVYQVNLTREYCAKGIECRSKDELDLYLRLRNESPNPYGCYFNTPFLSILSSSPEEFLCADLKNKKIRTRPIKGTLLPPEINIDEKNAAENIMICDLERNDLGKVCEYGTVRAEKLLEVEKYKHLNHVVSTIEGTLNDNVSIREIFEALFPGGSITGAPKIAAMKIIKKLEPNKRKVYTGSFGYIKTNGEMNFNILIRTIFIDKTKSNKKISFNVGGGIVADSNPQSELEEIHLKSKGILKALSNAKIIS